MCKSSIGREEYLQKEYDALDVVIYFSSSSFLQWSNDDENQKAMGICYY